MKKISIVVLVLFLLSIVSPAFALIQAFRLGAVGQDSLVGVQTLVATPSASNYMTFESPVGTDYQVPAGYTFYVTQIIADIVGEPIIGYGDDGVADAGNAPTNWKALTSRLGVGIYNIVLKIPAEKYPCCLEGGTSVRTFVTITGVEIAD